MEEITTEICGIKFMISNIIYLNEKKNWVIYTGYNLSAGWYKPLVYILFRYRYPGWGDEASLKKDVFNSVDEAIKQAEHDEKLKEEEPLNSLPKIEV